MIKLVLFFLTLSWVVGCASTPTRDLVAVDVPKDAVLVVVEDPRSERLRSLNSGTYFAAPIDYANDPILWRYADKIAADYGQTVLQQWPLKSLAVHCFVITRPDEAELERLAADTRVKWVQPFNEHQVQSSTEDIISSQWNPKEYRDLHRDLYIGAGAGTKISVIDTGADLSHIDLSEQRVIYEDFVESKGFGQNEKHGTSILGLLLAKPSTEKQVVNGLANDAKVQHLRACWESDEQGVCNTLTLALALDAVAEWRPHVLNLSISGPKDRVLDAIISLLSENGTIIVGAHDDRRIRDDRFPSPQPHVVYAKAAWPKVTTASEPNTFIAPEFAMSLSPMDSYDLVTGHSIAAPYITAMVAQLRARMPNASYSEIMNFLNEKLSKLSPN